MWMIDGFRGAWVGGNVFVRKLGKKSGGKGATIMTRGNGTTGMEMMRSQTKWENKGVRGWASTRREYRGARSKLHL